MTKRLYTLLFLSFLMIGFQQETFAGNPDRQGEAGAYELLMIPYARVAGLHALSTANVTGVDAIRLNVAGLGRTEGSEVNIGHSRYLVGTGINMNALGFASKIGENGAMGFSLMALDFGDIPVTTTDQPEGTGSTFSPSFFNLGLSYAYTFENKVSVGVTLRGISESTADINAFAFGLDAGVQYVTGEQDNFKLGISIRNVGSKMKFGGEGLNELTNTDGGYQLTLSQRSAAFELPSMLTIGASYDFLLNENMRLTVLGSFIANSFSQDEIGAGVEFGLTDMFVLRAAYKTDLADVPEEQSSIYSGLSAGATVSLPLSADEAKQQRFSVDYAYRQTRLWDGTHNIGVRFNF